MKKMNFITLLSWIVKLIMFSIFLVVIWKIFGLFKPYLISIIDNLANNESAPSENLASALLGFLDIVVSAIATGAAESFFTGQQDIPRVFISSPQVDVKNVSGIKMIHTHAPNLCIHMGNKQPRFRIVYAQIKNTGKRIISECSINKQAINIILDPDQSSKLYFLIYESANDTKKNKNFNFSYCIRDDQGNTYSGKYRMQVDFDKLIAKFCSYKKIKRSIFKNAISNL